MGHRIHHIIIGAGTVLPLSDPDGRITPGGDRLGFQGIQWPAVTHFIGDHSVEIPFKVDMVDRTELSAVDAKLHIPKVIYRSVYITLQPYSSFFD